MYKSIATLPVAVLIAGSGATLDAQQGVSAPSLTFVVSGYGTAGAMKVDEVPGTFFASVAPIFLFQFTDRLLFETELEFELEDGGTATGLEYANISLLPHDWVAITAGKFLVPFGVFSQRLHSSWINRFATNPPMYGHGGGISGFEPLIPILSDIGVLGSLTLPLGASTNQIAISGFVTNGPMPEPEMEGDGGSEEMPELGFGGSVEDNNSDKLIGGRVGLVAAPRAELDVSVIRAQWGLSESSNEALGFLAMNVAGELRLGPAELRGEWMRIALDAERVGAPVPSPAMQTIHRWGFYAQGTLRAGQWEQVVRYSVVEPNGDQPADDLRQYALGVNYYLTPSVSVMVGAELNRDDFNAGSDLDNNRLVTHWAFGF